MIHDAFTAKKIAELLIQINAIKLEPKNPFTWASGWKSPIYCDNRIALSYPTVRTYIREQFAKQIEAIYGKPDVIAGVATGAIGIGTLVAEELNLPFVYIRPKPKGHGRKNQIEGSCQKTVKSLSLKTSSALEKAAWKPLKHCRKAMRRSSACYRFLITIFRLPKNDLKRGNQRLFIE